MNSSALRTLLAIEDNVGDARLLREMLREEDGHNTALILASNMAEAEKLLEEHAFDIILLDLGLPDVQGMDAVRRVRLAAPMLPLVVLTGLDDELIAGQALQEGAQDYIIKGQIDLRGLLRAFRYAFERKSMEDTARELSRQIAHTAEHDDLTGLPNRMMLNDRIEFAIALATRHQSKLALLFLDLDGFKHINDSLGHSMGDKLLKSIAGRLRECVRGADIVSRQGGDEFVVLLSDANQSEDAAIIADRILQAISNVHNIDDRDLYVTASVGISIFPDDGYCAETLLKNADTAMYQAKDTGRHTYRFFRSTMNEKAVERLSITTDLRQALEQQEFELHYQPKIDLITGQTSGAEALIRWNHPTRGWIPPVHFIPIAEDSRLILPIGEWVLREACRQAQRWTAEGFEFGTMAVNVSAIQFREPDFAERLFAILGEVGMDPKRLELELTESVLMTGVGTETATLQSLRAKGVLVSLDDFGTGFSSLSYLERFPVDCLKIDQSFVRQISMAGTKSTLVTAIINMAHTLGLRVVAEGVETKEELQFIKNQGCDEGQGYYFSKPLTSSDFAKRLALTSLPKTEDRYDLAGKLAETARSMLNPLAIGSNHKQEPVGPIFDDIVKTALFDLIEVANDGILITSASELDQPRPRIIFANAAFCEISGFGRDEVIGKTPRILQGPGTSKKALGRIAEALRAGQECQEELLNYSRDGKPYWLDVHIVPLRDDTGTIRYFGAIERDVTDMRTQTEHLERLALEDILTGIGNRAALERHMEELAQAPVATPEAPCLLLFDLDRFKVSNDSLGHMVGDEILRHFAGCVASTLHRDDFMARLGGDEFVAVLQGYTPEAARLFAENVVSNLASMKISSADKIGVSVGITFFQPGNAMETVIDAADMALHRAQDAGKGQVRVHNRPRAV
jgi:diguanylate cyclase (GGDEF)-like protein/PAS domain S-box-containing protein